MSKASALLEAEAPLGDDVDAGALRFERGPKSIRLHVGEVRCYLDVRLRLADPLRYASRYVSLIDRKDREICLLDSLTGLPASSRALAEEELAAYYGVVAITRVLDLSYRYGPLYWRTETPRGEREFVVRWNADNVLRLDDGSLRLTDVDGNRFLLPPASRLDAESRKRVEVLR